MKKILIILLIALLALSSVFSSNTERKSMSYSGAYVSWGGVMLGEDFISNVAAGLSYNWAAFTQSGKMGYGMDLRLDALFDASDAKYLGVSTLAAPAIFFPISDAFSIKAAVGPEASFSLNLEAGTSGLALGIGGDISVSIMPPQLDIIGIEIGVAPKLLFNIPSLGSFEDNTLLAVIPYVSISLGKFGREIRDFFD